MIWTLHRYVLRELLKVFTLTALGLTLIFSMGGGLLNLIKIQQVSAGDVAKLLLWFLPLVASFMLPIAALLSAALTYGRLAADNELDACKAGGINILKLLASCVILAVGVCLVTFYLSNFTVPSLIRKIDTIAKRDIQDWVVAQLQDRGYIRFQNYAVYADDARKLSPEEVAKMVGIQDRRIQVVYIRGAAFVEFQGDDPARTGTASSAVLVFDKRSDPMKLRATLLKVMVFDHTRGQFIGIERQPIEPTQIPTPVRTRLKWFDLKELIYFRDHPEQTPAMQARLRLFRQNLAGCIFYKRFVEALLRKPHKAVLKAPWGEYSVTAKAYQIDQESGRPILSDVTIEQKESGQTIIYKADRAVVSVQKATEALVVTIRLNGKVLRISQDNGSPTLPLPSGHELRSVPLPREVISQANAYSDAELLDPKVPLPVSRALQRARIGLARELEHVRRQVNAVVHARITLSVSTLVLVLLAAALGIIIRGGHAFTAFGISFIPTVIVVIAITMGRQLAEKAGTVGVGIGLMWAVLAAMAVLDGIIVFKVIRR